MRKALVELAAKIVAFSYVFLLPAALFGIFIEWFHTMKKAWNTPED